MISVIYREAADCGETLVSALKSQRPQDLWLTHTYTDTQRTCGLNTHSQFLCQNPKRVSPTAWERCDRQRERASKGEMA